LTNFDTIQGINKKEKIYGCLMQDSAMAHTQNFSLSALEEVLIE
jgi:hypothetical protein